MDNELTFSAQEIASHLQWRLSNSNSEISLDDGRIIDVAFNAWVDENGESAFDLNVSGWDQDSGQRGERSFRVTLTEVEDES